MPDYRRHRLPGGTYFFTANLLERRSDLLTRHIALLRAAVRAVRRARPFHIDAWVVLPDHLHCIWTLPRTMPMILLVGRPSKSVSPKRTRRQEYRSCVRRANGERGIWQRRFWEHTIRDERDYAAHMDYVHINPIKHGLVARVIDWPYSTFHRDVDVGLYPKDWAGKVPDLQAGEPKESKV